MLRHECRPFLNAADGIILENKSLQKQCIFNVFRYFSHLLMRPNKIYLPLFCPLLYELYGLYFFIFPLLGFACHMVVHGLCYGA